MAKTKDGFEIGKDNLKDRLIKDYWIYGEAFYEEAGSIQEFSIQEFCIKLRNKRCYLADEVDKALAEAVKGYKEFIKRQVKLRKDHPLEIACYAECQAIFEHILEKHMGKPADSEDGVNQSGITRDNPLRTSPSKDAKGKQKCVQINKKALMWLPGKAKGKQK